jgi:3D (Asp-Asp-Asp) domain-containing protein
LIGVRIYLIALALVSVASSAESWPRSNQHAAPHAMRMRATAYCDRGPTKSGVRAQPGVVAADVRRLPLGTRLRVLAPGQPYAGVYTVLDTGARIKGRNLDIFMPSCRAAKRFGKRRVQVRILTIRR